jgi:hypothetical protein
VVWTLIGGGIGFGAGLVIGLQKFDDAVGGLAGALLSRPRKAPPVGEADRDPLWNGMLIGAAAGAGVGMVWIPETSCNTDVNPECPWILRLSVGIPAVAGGAALGALIDRAVGPRRASAHGPTRTTTVLSPVIGPGTVGVRFYRAF